MLRPVGNLFDNMLDNGRKPFRGVFLHGMSNGEYEIRVDGLNLDVFAMWQGDSCSSSFFPKYSQNDSGIH